MLVTILLPVRSERPLDPIDNARILAAVVVPLLCLAQHYAHSLAFLIVMVPSLA
jgi:hypothetical protein